MNAKKQDLEQGVGVDSSEPSLGILGDRSASSESWLSPGADTMKRAAAKKLIERYFYQLVDGCGDPNCSNENCASSGRVKNVTPNQAAAQAFQLFSKEAKLCDAHPPKIARTQNTPMVVQNVFGILPSVNSATPSNSYVPVEVKKEPEPEKIVPFLNESKLNEIIAKCLAEDSYVLLIRTLGEVFSSPESLAKSFQRHQPETPIELMLEKAGEKDLRSLKKEDVRELEGDLDKDQDSKEEEEKNNQTGENSMSTFPCYKQSTQNISLDLPSLRRAYSQLFKLPIKMFEGPLVNAIVSLMEYLEFDLKVGSSNKKKLKDEDVVNLFVIMIELPMLGSSEFIDVALPHISKAAAHLPISCQAKLAWVWSKYCTNKLKPLLDSLQQLITLKVIVGYSDAVLCHIQDEDIITAPTRVIKLIFYASILAGEMDPPGMREEEPAPVVDDSILGGSAKTVRPPQFIDPLEAELQISVLDSRVPLIPFKDFYNESLSESVEMDKDFTNFKLEASTKKFSFMHYPFILSPATKTMGLYYDNRIRMYSERRISFFQAAVGQPANPYLKLKVRRDHIIEDALVELELIAMENPKDLKKQLVVEFEGEQGIDEGGLSKEFFQLVVEEIFNPDYGMFVQQPDTGTVWFNPTSFESDAQFTLIGIVLGLAIYNSVILQVRFPMVLYRKLMGKRGSFFDLQDWNPTLFSGLKSLLEHEGDDIESVFGVSFKICYTDVFGSALYHELKDDGDNLMVNQDNKQEYVDLYTDFLLNRCIEKQFRAFQRGFSMVTDESPLGALFRPEEVELLVCGSSHFDFKELEETTEYDGGYAADTPIVKQFWELVHAMPMDDKRKLLQFTTGSDRVPVGGLRKVKLIIAKNGPDSDRLPTAHTCFNVLLLPEYSSPSKLQERLEKAINYSKGFGML